VNGKRPAYMERDLQIQKQTHIYVMWKETYKYGKKLIYMESDRYLWEET